MSPFLFSESSSAEQEDPLAFDTSVHCPTWIAPSNHSRCGQAVPLRSLHQLVEPQSRCHQSALMAFPSSGVMLWPCLS